MLSISVDDRSDLYKIAPFVKDHEIVFPVATDDGIKDLYAAKAFPTTIIIDRDGIIRYRDTGFNDDSPRTLETVVSMLLDP